MDLKEMLEKNGKAVAYADERPPFFNAFLDQAGEADIWWTFTVEDGSWTFRMRPALMPAMRASDLGLA
jgi:hypothetical protein